MEVLKYYCDACKKEGNVSKLKYEINFYSSTHTDIREVDLCNICYDIVSRVISDTLGEMEMEGM